MRQITPIFKREFFGYFRSPVAYVFLVAFRHPVSLAFSRYGGFFRAVLPAWKVTSRSTLALHNIVPAVGMRLGPRKTLRYRRTALHFAHHHFEAVPKFLAAWAFLAMAILLSFGDRGLSRRPGLGRHRDDLPGAAQRPAVTSASAPRFGADQEQVISFVLSLGVCHPPVPRLQQLHRTPRASCP